MANYKSAKRYVKKVARKARGMAIKRYFNKGYQPKMDTIMSDVNMLKNLLNTEKKHTTLSANGLTVGQLSANIAGLYALEITPVPTAGVSEIQRTGTSIKLTSSYMKFQFSAQANAINRTRLKIMIIQTSGNYVSSVNSWLTDKFKHNPFITGASIIDYNSSFNTNTFGGFKILRTFNFTMAPDSITNESNIKTLTLGLKYNRGKGTHIRYQSGTSTPANNQLFMIVMADTGNCNPVTASTGISGVAQTAVNTGFNWQYYITHYYVDN